MTARSPGPRAILLLTLLAGCATDRLHSEGMTAFQMGDYETAIANLEKAAKEDPSSARIQYDYRTRKEAAVQILDASGDRARSSGNLDAAATFYKRALAIEPTNDRALRGVNGVAADRRHAERVAKAEKLFAAKSYEAADIEVQAVLAENPAYGPASELLARIDRARGPTSAIPRLKTRDDRPVSLQFREAPTKMVFEVLARQTGINFVFDKDVKGDGKTTLFVQAVAVEQAIDLILAQNQLGRQVLSDNIVLIYPNTPAKQKDYRDEIVHTFYLTNAAPKEVESLLKTVLGAKTVFVDEHANVVVIRDTPEHVRMAERLVASIDVAEPEVIMEVNVLEVTTSLLQQLGVQYPTSVSMSFTKPPNSTSPQLTGLSISDLGKQTADTIGFAASPLGITIDLAQTNGAANLLSSPRIRARNKEKAKILVGDKLPVVTSGTSATTGGSYSTSNVQYIDVGLTLEVQPTIHNDGSIAIKLGLEVSQIIKPVTVPIGNGGSTLAYQIGTRNASTLLELKDGETQVLGGLIQDADTRSTNQIPGLGDIPVLGKLFGSTNTNRQKNEIVMSITPRIVRMQSRPPVETMEFWYGSEAQTRSGPFASTAGAGAGSFGPGGVAGGAGGGAAAPGVAAPSGPRPVPQRVEASPATPTPPPPSRAPEGPAPAASEGSNPAGTAIAAAYPTVAAAAAAAGATGAAAAAAGAAGGGTEAALAAKPPDAKAAENPAASKPVATASADGKPRVAIEGPETARTGDQIDVSVKLSTGKALGRVRTQVAFDASALQLVSAEAGDLAPSGEAPRIDMKPGGVQVDIAGGEGAPVTGEGSLLDLKFRVVGAKPSTSLTTQVVLVGEDGVAVAATQATPLKIAIGK
jgi:general secretion pathway protein D